MYYYIYQITNLINKKIYIGKHKSAKHPANNNYYGSGKQITAAIEKYGKENFKKEVLYFCSSMEEMNAKEAEIVTEDFVKRNDTYNMHKGGSGGWDHWNRGSDHKVSARTGGKIAAKKLHDFLANQKRNNTEWWKNHHEKMKELNRERQHKTNTPDAIRKKKETFQKIKHSQGKNNSQYGKLWISNILTKEIRRITVDDIIPEGWVRGKKGHAPKKLWVNNAIKEHYVLIEKETEFILNGYNRGRLKNSMPQNRIVV